MTIYIQRTTKTYDGGGENHNAIVAVKPETVARVESYHDAAAVIRDMKRTDPSGVYYTSSRPCRNHLK